MDGIPKPPGAGFAAPGTPPIAPSPAPGSSVGAPPLPPAAPPGPSSQPPGPTVGPSFTPASPQGAPQFRPPVMPPTPSPGGSAVGGPSVIQPQAGGAVGGPPVASVQPQMPLAQQGSSVGMSSSGAAWNAAKQRVRAPGQPPGVPRKPSPGIPTPPIRYNG